MPRLYFLPAARQEVLEAFDWYENESKGLGEKFHQSLDAQLWRITDDPLQFPLILRDVRRARLNRFPYSLFFRLTNEAVFVIACFHASRNPRVWQSRIQTP